MRMYMIACHIDNKYNVIGFRITDVDTGEVQDYNYDLVKSVLAKGIQIDGIEIHNNEVVGNNGDFKRYTQLCNGITISKTPVVITKKYPDDSYDVCNHLGQVVRMSSSDIIAFASREGIANGKIVHSENGTHLSSIRGEFFKDASFVDVQYADKTRIKMKMLGVENIEMTPDGIVKGISDTKEKIILGRGCLGIAENGFKNYVNLKSISFVPTCTKFGKACFQGCTSLTEITIPEGTVEIPAMMFMNCRNLEKVTLPNSIRRVHDTAFRNCNNLTFLSMGPVRPETGPVRTSPRTRLEIRR